METISDDVRLLRAVAYLSSWTGDHYVLERRNGGSPAYRLAIPGASPGEAHPFDGRYLSARALAARCAFGALAARRRAVNRGRVPSVGEESVAYVGECARLGVAP